MTTALTRRHLLAAGLATGVAVPLKMRGRSGSASPSWPKTRTNSRRSARGITFRSEAMFSKLEEGTSRSISPAEE